MIKFESLLERINEHDENGLEKKALEGDALFNNRNGIISIIKCIQVLLYPNYYSYKGYSREEAMESFYNSLKEEIRIALDNARGSADAGAGDCANASADGGACDSANAGADAGVGDGAHITASAEELTDRFAGMLPDIFAVLQTDLQAIYDGDPAAKSKAEILLCYPGFYAILIYRIAHGLYSLGIPFIPRIMTEYAHEKTGIDIHPGATVGTHFCIDHGTGIVIGETAVLGHHVKLYQGVTIGAKSFEKDEFGNPVKSGKRHPNIGNHVTIYANATILGGTTNIGDGSTIGGNTWITKSVEENATVVKGE